MSRRFREALTRDRARHSRAALSQAHSKRSHGSLDSEHRARAEPVGSPPGGPWEASNSRAQPRPAHPIPGPHGVLSPPAWGQAGATLTLSHSHQTIRDILLALLSTPVESDHVSSLQFAARATPPSLAWL